MNDSPHLPLVRYSVRLRTAAWQELPPAVYDEDCWQVRELELDEGLDRPYVLDLRLITDELEVEVDRLVGARLSLSCQRGDDERLVHGIVMRAGYLGTYHDRLHLRLEVGPSLARLGLGQRSRVFQGKSVVQIVEEVVADAFGMDERTIDTSRLRRSYEELDYCVQLRESDLGFVDRILAREGIGYAFEHGETAETMVLFDDPRALSGASLSPADEREHAAPVIGVSTTASERAGTETIVSFEWRRAARLQRAELSAWDWKPWDPSPLRSSTHDEEPAPGAYGEHYAHDARRVVEQQGHGPHLDYTGRGAGDVHERQVVGSQTARGRGNVLAFQPGRTFELEGHPYAALDRSYALTQVVHRADCPESDADDTGIGAGANYENRFECVPAELPWRPRPRPRPTIHGHLLATVVGPAGEQIHTDEHGRIKVWLHWDREQGPTVADASCWLRVAQPWAGPGWGSMFIPRVGMEVLVSFADGDPDQPMCVGCVYNGHNRPPYPLPQERTKSTIKSSSSPGGEGFNELRFEDAKGQEQIFVHAERDHDEEVGRNHSRSVGHQESIRVTDDRSVTVGGSQTVTIEGNHRVAVQGTSREGTPLPGPHYSIEIDSELSVSANKTIVLEANESITLQVQGTRLTLTPTGAVLQAGQGAAVTLDAAALMKSSPGASVLLDPQGGLAIAAMVGPGMPGAALAMDGAAKLSSQAGATLQMGSDVTLSAPSGAGPGASLTLDSGATMSGHEVSLQAQASSLVLDAGAMLEGTSVEVTGAETTLAGASTTIRGQQIVAQGGALVTIMAPLVKIN
ncbi:MAG: type VI secretion system tip protein TssI/VgrG [Nannocystaceae bacterium]